MSERTKNAIAIAIAVAFMLGVAAAVVAIFTWNARLFALAAIPLGPLAYASAKNYHPIAVVISVFTLIIALFAAVPWALRGF